MLSFDWTPSRVKFLPEHTSTRVVGEAINHALRTPDANGRHRCQLTSHHKTTLTDRGFHLCALSINPLRLASSFLRHIACSSGLSCRAWISGLGSTNERFCSRWISSFLTVTPQDRPCNTGRKLGLSESIRGSCEIHYVQGTVLCHSSALWRGAHVLPIIVHLLMHGGSAFSGHWWLQAPLILRSPVEICLKETCLGNEDPRTFFIATMWFLDSLKQGRE